MINRITLDHKDFQFNESFLPCLVTGACKSGASYFSVSLIGSLVEQGSKVIFFTAFPMAKEELIHQVGNNKTFEITNEEQIQSIPQDKSIIIQSGNRDLWESVIQSIDNIDEYVIFVKNIEEYDKSIMEFISTNTKILLSGTLEDCVFKEDLVKKEWISKIIFTDPQIDLQIELPKLEKYESYLESKKDKGILRLKKIE
jgi:hypothetical protein